MESFPNVTSIPSDNLLNYAHNRQFLTCLLYRETLPCQCFLVKVGNYILPLKFRAKIKE